jgi:UPF0755 protein
MFRYSSIVCSRACMIKFLLGIALTAVLGLAGWLVYYGMSALPAAPEASFVVESGASLSSVAHNLERDQLIDHAWSFTALGRMFGLAGRIKAGSYQVGAARTHYGLLRKMSQGTVSLAKLTVVEGWTVAQMRAAVDAHADLRHESRTLSDRELMAALGADNQLAEGRFFPDTYFFDRGSSDLDVYRRAHGLMQEKLAAAWAARAPGLPLRNPGEALTMASIIEKETGAPEERPLIASVFVNRLRIGMRLQTDPTVIYGLGEASTATCARTICSPIRRTTPTPGPDCRPRPSPCRGARPWQQPSTAGQEPMPCISSPRATAADITFPDNLDDHNRAVSPLPETLESLFMTGLFITLEGVDGAGKSSHLDWLAIWFRDKLGRVCA